MLIIHFFLKSIGNRRHNELDSGFLPSAIMCSATVRAQRWHRLPTHTTKSTEAQTLSGSTHCTLTVSPCVFFCVKVGVTHLIFCLVFFFFCQVFVFLASGSNRESQLLFTAVCKIQISFSLNANVQRSRSSALNAMPTTRGRSGNAPNCREESDISERGDEPGG